MNHFHRRRPHAHLPPLQEQRGAALFVGLMILLVLAIIGVSGVRSVIMEKNMVTNNQYQMLVFQAAETAIEGTFADGTVLVDAINTPVSGTWPTRSYSITQGYYSQPVTSSASISVDVQPPPDGFSLDQFVSYEFSITGDGAIASINAADTHVLTASQISPCPTC